MPVLAAHGDDHQLGTVHHLLVVGAHPDALVALGQLRGSAGSPRGEEDLWRPTVPVTIAVTQALHDGSADLAHSDDADPLHCVCLSGRWCA